MIDVIVTYLSFTLINICSYPIHFVVNINKNARFREDGHLFAWVASLWIGGIYLLLYSVFVYVAIFWFFNRKRNKPEYPRSFLLLIMQSLCIYMSFQLINDLITLSIPLLGLYLSVISCLYFTQITTILVFHLLNRIPWKFREWRRNILILTWVDAFSLSTFLLISKVLPVIEGNLIYQIIAQTFLLIFVIIRFTLRNISILQQSKMTETIEEVNVLNHKLEVTNDNILAAFASSLEKRDAYTAGHSERVAKYAYLIAAEFKIIPSYRRIIHLSGLLHDIGKIGIPDYILHKEGPLSEHEYYIMKQHPIIGEELLRGVYQFLPFLTDGEKKIIYEIVLYHHERPDGLGYPMGLNDEAIPIHSKIMAVADAFDAMTSNRSYRPAMTQDKALDILRKGSGTQFWTPAVQALEVLLQGNFKKV
ncbi:HD-GYP domain-containing protein [Paenibacillus frigoriresistens]|uniref:HD-GYP domain-containing protein n=1 Tax=Paenibacillus alginolyticus TaxID=59839 RepID=UPI001565D3FA|nr:HD-GYP domain-containing protein [Paenibacillus frigoriresistens]NRF94554.1 HD-GYP domain-containing protein [Paenibacillus frigoriresistens]